MVGSRHRGNEDYANYLDCQHDWIDKHLERSVKHDSGWGVSVVSSEGEVGRKHPPCGVWKAPTDRQSPVESMGRTLRKPVSKWVLDLCALPGCCDVKFRIPPLSPHHHGLRPLKVRANIKPSFLCLSFATAVKNKTDLTMTSTGRNWKSEPRRKSFCLWRWTAPAVGTPSACTGSPDCRPPFQVYLKWNHKGVYFSVSGVRVFLSPLKLTILFPLFYLPLLQGKHHRRLHKSYGCWCLSPVLHVPTDGR